MNNIQFLVGEPVPWFKEDSSAGDDFNLSQIAGRYVVLYFFGSSETEGAQKILPDIYKCKCFDDDTACFFGITVNPSDKECLQGRIPGIRYYWDFEGKISQMYGALGNLDYNVNEPSEYKTFTLVLDSRLRVLKLFQIDNPEQHAAELNDYITQLPHPRRGEPEGVYAPVLVVPRIFDPEFCKHLIDLYHKHGGEELGFMSEKNGMTVKMSNPDRKRRSDYVIEDKQLIDVYNRTIKRRLIPEIARAFAFNATIIERYIVACYEGEREGHFHMHRDNTTKGTVHRRFAVTINLNTGEYDGGELIFPEFGQRKYVAPLGGAVVFSCSLLHMATPVTKGNRYCTLPFLYNDSTSQIRKENRHLIKSDTPPLEDFDSFVF